MTRLLACLLILAVGAHAAPIAAGEPEIKTETGYLQELIARLASSDYVLGEPARDARPYVDPTASALHAFRHLAAALAWGDVHSAALQAEKLDYEVVRFVDAETSARYFVLREDLSGGRESRGWGSYIVNRDSRVDALVEVPHPLADAQTPEIGGVVFEQAEAKGFLLAGAHRAKADVPDLVESIFHQVHAAWVGPAARVAAWQIHGFVLQNHAFPSGAHIVASTGDGVVAPEVASLDAICENQGLKSYVFNDRPPKSRVNKLLNDNVPGVTFTSLAATTNEQGRLSRSLGGSFVHVELESRVRLDAGQRDRAASVIASAMAAPPSEPADGGEPELMLTSLEEKIDSAAAARQAEDVLEAAGEPSEGGPERRVAARPIVSGPPAHDIPATGQPLEVIQ